MSSYSGQSLLSGSWGGNSQSANAYSWSGSSFGNGGRDPTYSSVLSSRSTMDGVGRTQGEIWSAQGASRNLAMGFVPFSDLSDIADSFRQGSYLAGMGMLALDIPGFKELKGLEGAGDFARFGVQANRAQGKAGEAITAAALRQNGTFSGKQVTFETSTGQRTVMDFVINGPTGKGVIETKTGNAMLRSGQRQLFDDIQNGRQVIPRGANAERAGLEPGKPATLHSCGIDRPCP